MISTDFEHLHTFLIKKNRIFNNCPLFHCKFQLKSQKYDKNPLIKIQKISQLQNSHNLYND
jgi:hypothetical protein